MTHRDQHPQQPSQPADPLARYLTAGAGCPSWCEHRDAHPYDLDPWEEDPARRWHRLHTRTLRHGEGTQLHATVQQLDHAPAPDETPTRHAPTVLLEPTHGAVELAGPHQLRQLAALLLDLAAQLPEDLRDLDGQDRSR